ncbi:GAF domain-containing protein [Streptomyces sp. NEAU-Y11]|uniref:GAF domain-containing protein n=1 Tax=Streptomyces cucumeris TaxID=2962890 RepID=UPI0020C8B902|nr:GAF domain-containing protein [Streptomyces sp. NEAU-Y11]MCP9207873.1 GAF domain-containing protein [Streptomyces sp. NEAU-Y11]
MRIQHPRHADPLAALSPAESARLMAVMRDTALSRGQLPLPARPVIGQSWDRMLRLGLDPDRGGTPRALSLDELERRRQQTRLADVLPTLHSGLLEAAEAAGHLMIIADGEGRVLWIDGHRGIRRHADGIALVEGSQWAEEVTGTTGIGTALAVRAPVRVHSAEHFVRAFHTWSCAAAPLRDPRDGRLLGVIDISGPAPTAHPTVLSLVTATARWAEGELRLAHSRELDRLRAVAAPVLARIRGKAVAVDPHGWVVGVTGVNPRDRRLLLPKAAADGPVWLPALGSCVVEPLPGGHLLRVLEGEYGADGVPAAAGRLVLDVRHPHHWSLTFSGPAGTWTHQLSARHAEVLLVLAAHPGGRTAAQLAEDLFGDPTRTVTVRAAMSRLRGRLGAVLAHRPYRIADGIRLEVTRPDRPRDLLPLSVAPAVVRLRDGQG